VGTLGLILATVYALRAVLKTTFGPVQERFLGLTDIRAVESVSMFVLVGLITLIGIAPAVLGGPMHVTLQLLVSKIGG
jgi:NADH-quinone oxidoreductase subunit M